MTRPVRSRQRGLTLIELMVSVALSLVILSAMSYIYVSSRGVYRSNEAMARVQETGRFALEWIARDIRNAGNFGCGYQGSLPQLNVIANPPAPAPNTLQAVFGYEQGKDTSSNYWPDPTGSAPSYSTGLYQQLSNNKSDVLQISGMIGVPGHVTDNQAGNANVKIDQNCSGISQDDLVIACNFKQATLFRVTNNVQQNCTYNPAPGYDVTAAGGGNITPGFKMPFTKSDQAILFKLANLDYFVGTNPAGNPALYRVKESTAQPGNPSNGVVEEVAENIEDMNLLFGVDTNGDGLADQYSNANTVSAGGYWNNVVSVRVALVARSTETAALQSPQTYFFQPSVSGTYSSTVATDRRFRQVFTTTVALRNRLP